MSQQDILKIMEKNPDKSFTSREFKEILKLKAVHENLRRLYIHGEVKRVWVKTKKGGNEKEYLYSLK